MKRLQPFIFLAFLLFLGGCITQPSACFNNSSSRVAPGESVSFSNCSFNAANFSWDFGDGTTSTEKAPTHAWDSAGFYKVTLTATHRSGNFSEVADNITVE